MLIFVPHKPSYLLTEMMKRPILLLSLLLAVLTLQAKKTYTIVVSMDGFRWDYTQKYHAPNIEQVGREGVWTNMLPSYPASTFPNHYAIATGLVPDHHGIVNNTFWDPKTQTTFSSGNPETSSNGYYFGGEPIWLTAQHQGLKTSIVYWVGSDVAVQGEFPNSYKSYREPPLLDYYARVDTAMAHLSKPKSERPSLVMIYFDEPDHQAHLHGPDSPEVEQAVARVDSVIGYLRSEISKLKIAKQVNLILLADHGMSSIADERCVRPSDYLKPEWYERIVPGIPAFIFSKPQYRDSIAQALEHTPHVQYYKKEDIPALMQFGTNERAGDILVVPNLGWQFGDTPKHQSGNHGYDPHDKEMWALFRAVGPSFKKGGYKSSMFQNIDIYPLLCHLLGIKPAPVDGKLERIREILR